MKTIKIESFSDIPKKFTGLAKYSNGTKWWYKEGKRHRGNGLPAVEDSGGSKHWYKEGKLHRENDLPAVEDSDGTKWWYKEGKRHRGNGLPAVEDSGGTKEYWINGEEVCKEAAEVFGWLFKEEQELEV